VDCFYETAEGLVIVDFKTDRVSGEKVSRRAEEYRAQVEAYSTALAAIFEKKVCRKVLYFFHTNSIVEL
jgi:ATP-dependent helicase/nuclease subunit A